jgi:hypothetical protein
MKRLGPTASVTAEKPREQPASTTPPPDIGDASAQYTAALAAADSVLDDAYADYRDAVAAAYAEYRAAVDAAEAKYHAARDAAHAAETEARTKYRAAKAAVRSAEEEAEAEAARARGFISAAAAYYPVAERDLIFGR